MTMKSHTHAVAAMYERDVGGLNEPERQLIYARCGLTQAQIANAETMVRNSGLRDVGSGALNNVRVQLHSKKNGSSRTVESHTCERLFAYSLEMDLEVLAYYVQVPCRRIIRIKDNGQQHVSQATLDFLVFYNDRVELVECKYERWLQKAALESVEWELADGRWTCTPYENWATVNGLSFEVWFPPWPLGIYLRNEEAAYALKGVALNAAEQRAADRAFSEISVAPRSLDELCEIVPNFRERIALWLIAHSKAFGPMQSTPIEMGSCFLLYSDPRQAECVDRGTLHQIACNFAQPQLNDPLITAPTTDFQKAAKRLERLDSIACGKDNPTRRMTELARHVSKVVAAGRSRLSACLTRYASSGNRESRLLEGQRVAIESVIRTHWDRYQVRTLRTLWFELEDECKRRSVPTPKFTTLNRAVKQQDVTKRALAMGGMRAYQSVRSSSDPRDRSQHALGYGHTLHIDSSIFDNRCAPDLVLLFPAEKPTFYIGVDEATSMPMAHSLIFGSARTDGFAILIREFVFRHGFLPCVIFVDRGPENTSDWLKEFCRQEQISLMHSPTGGSVFNGLAENTIKQINTQVAHDFAGSTELDMKGRSVDGKYKSRNNAKTTFLTISKAFDEFVYGDLLKTPLADGGTPSEKRDESLSRYGNLGRLHEYNDDLLIKTSILIDFKGKATERKGIRTGEGFFTSEELKIHLRSKQPDAVRRDCADPSVLYVKIDSAWVKAFHSSAQSIALMSKREKLFVLMSQPLVNRERRSNKLAVDRDRYHRHRAQAAMPAHPHLAPSAKEETTSPENLDVRPPVPEWDALESLPEE
ncbi:hypothetical protein AB7849_08755 [Rhodanobacter sp. 115]|uniref:transposase n=1 Tax=Rhodanobacter sp. FW021-MT20 TaxID=1162282 RepID=UPI000260C9D8|nr:transposase [Rhodanobacter sp. 115]EIL95693.1 transposase [Rhodanobacter sp. 115]